MSLKSMTGHGRGNASGHGLRVAVELNSVNRKQLDVHMRMPRLMASLESRVHERIQKAISRGRITGEICVVLYGSAVRQSVRINEDLARAYVDQLRASARKLGIRDTIDIRTLLSLPDVICQDPPPIEPEKMWEVLHRALEKALRQLQRMRRDEGKELKKDLSERCVVLRTLTARIYERAPGVAERYRVQLLERLERHGLAGEEHGDKLTREVAVFADKCDITEEITRLGSHVKQAGRLLRTKEPAGRTLDFLAQEMLREVNTIASKANDADIVRDVVEFKTQLERLREQVQNVE